MYIYCAICYYTIASIHCTLRHHTILLIRMHTYVHWVVGKREHIPVETTVNLSNRMCVTFNKSICHLSINIIFHHATTCKLFKQYKTHFNSSVKVLTNQLR